MQDKDGGKGKVPAAPPLNCRVLSYTTCSFKGIRPVVMLRVVCFSAATGEVKNNGRRNGLARQIWPGQDLGIPAALFDGGFQDGRERRFAYPTAFERFLRFENPAFQGRAAVDLSAAKQDAARQEDARAQARLARELELQAARTAELKAKRANSARNAATTRAANKKAAAKD